MTTPGSARALVVQLVEAGLSRRQIGASLGVNDSYIGRVFRGERGSTGDKYAGRLAQLIDELEARRTAGVPVRRGESIVTTAPVEKRTQKVRRPARVYESRRASTARAGKQAAQNGARSLAGEVRYAAAEGRMVVVVLTCTSEAVARRATYGRKIEPKGRRRLWTFELGPMPADELAEQVEAAGGSVVEGAILWSVEAGQYESELDEDELHTIVGAEVRTWDA